MAKFLVRPEQLRKLVKRVEEKRDKSPKIVSQKMTYLSKWYLEMADSVLELPMHNQRITLTGEDFEQYFKFLYESGEE